MTSAPATLPVLDRPEWDPECRACGLCRGVRSYRIWGEGNPNSELVLLGEAPGEEEDERGRPFVGRAGWILNRALTEAGLDRREVFVANAVKCRPANAAGKNRPPSLDELLACRTWLDEELACLPHKKVLVAMGGTAMQALLHPHAPTGGVFENQGKIFWSERYHCTMVATIHPALALRKPGEAQWLTLDLRKAMEIARTGRLPERKQPRYRVVRSLADALEMEAALARAPYLVWDWETAPNPYTWGDAVHPTQAIGYCVSFCGEADFAWVAPRYGAGLRPLPTWPRTRAEIAELDAVLRRIFLLPVPKIGHHVAFDINVCVSTLGVRPVNVVGDTMLANHTLYNHLSERAHGLKRMSDVYTEYGRYDDELDAWLVANGYTRDGKANGAYTYKVPNEMLWRYNATDSIVPWLMHPILEARLRAVGRWECYAHERVPFAIEYAELDRYGLPTDRARVQAQSAEFGEAMEHIKAEIGQMVLTWKCPAHGRVYHVKCCDQAKGGPKAAGYPGEPLNPNSGPQVGDYLYGYQGLPILARTETGQPSTKEEVLKTFEEADPLVPPILHYRTFTKLKGTYGDGKLGDAGILPALDPDGYTHPSTMLTVVETLRLATRKPFPTHLIPRPMGVYHCAEHGRYKLQRCCAAAVSAVLNIRGMVRPKSDREVLVAGDFDQQEYVLAAIAAGQADMEEACLDRGEDAHAFVMRILTGRSKSEFQDAGGRWLSTVAEAEYANMRSAAKSTNFMVLYLGGPEHLAKDIGGSIEEAAQQIEDYYHRLPKIKEWQTAITKRLEATGRVEGLFGVGRALPNIYSPYRSDRNEAIRQACNFPFQNGGAHILARTVVRFTRKLRQLRFPGRLLFTVHDELVCLTRRDRAAELGALLKAEMEMPHPELVGGCGIPRGVRASIKVMDEWGGAALTPPYAAKAL